jgi:hypothetical protein
MSKGDPVFKVTSTTVKKTCVTLDNEHIEEALKKVYNLKGNVRFDWHESN